MLTIAQTLNYYKNPLVQKLISWHSRGREVGIRLLSGQFASRPNTIEYPSDVLEFAKVRASSFHISEEHWQDPWLLSSAKGKELEDLRTGWDLVLDLDFPVFESTKLITIAVINALKAHGIKHISCKFSGNKGFHIGVPFESFPKEILGEETRRLFPDGPKKIMSYIVNYIDNKENGYALSKKILESDAFRDFKDKNPDKAKLLIQKACANCGNILPNSPDKKIIYKCPNCGTELEDGSQPYKICPNCSRIMKRIEIETENKCNVCGSTSIQEKINLAIDEILIAPRHLYRAPYSLHEKSGLASLPISPENVARFERENASREEVLAILDKFNGLQDDELFNALDSAGLLFLNPDKAEQGEASTLLIEAFDFDKKREMLKEATTPNNFQKEKRDIVYDAANNQRFEEESFPPCIKLALKGVSDGRKRLVFILFNFLRSSGWTLDEISARLYEWNKNNEEPLRDAYIKSQIEYQKKGKPIPPPNCDASGYYKDMGICHPDAICQTIKNPVSYPRRYVKRFMKKTKKTKKSKKS